MQNHKYRNIVFIIATIVIIAMTFFLNLYEFYGFPREIKIIKDKDNVLEIKLPFTQPLSQNEKDLMISGFSKTNNKTNLSNPIIIRSSKLGTYDLELRLLGLIPVRKMKVHVLPELRVVPGGHSLGVKLRPNGVIVVGFTPVMNAKGQICQPANDAGIEIGDTICKIDGKKISSAEDISEIINKTDKEKAAFILTIKRNNKIINKSIKAIRNKKGVLQLGLWVRDIAAGVGTLTFYDPKTGFYGALGHLISDADTGKTIEVGKGEIIRSKVSSISPGKKNHPGEKRGVFIEEENVIGNIIANTDFGIFGKSYYKITNPIYPTLPIAPATQAHIGEAKILTVVDDEKIEEFSIKIQKIIRQPYPNAKGMIIQITDPKLLKKTGGIVQGMSGSPIIQDGYIIGAVTHVFVNDPTKGYGVFAEWMFEEMSKLSDKTQSVSDLSRNWYNRRIIPRFVEYTI